MVAKAQARHTLSYQLREIVESRGLTAYRLGELSGVDHGVVSRWLSGARDIRMETADKLALALGLRLTETSRWIGGRGRPKRAKAARDPRSAFEVAKGPGEGGASPSPTPDEVDA